MTTRNFPTSSRAVDLPTRYRYQFFRMIPLTLGSYKVPIDSSALLPTATKLLQAASSPKTLQEALNLDPLPDPLPLGIPPAKNTAELKKRFHAYLRRLALEKARLAAGFPDLIGPRKGLKGLIQKWFRDPKEPLLPIELDLIQWLESCPRYQLLVALHDSLLNTSALADPQPVSLEDIDRFSHPLAQLIAAQDLKRLTRLTSLLTAPIHKVPPQAILDDVAGYVVTFDTRSGFAYYFG
ncbi:MAG: hypothetical protein SNJ84_09480 [Verrucomicrobiia bacterium]